MHKHLNGLTLVLYCGLIFWLSDQSQLPVPELFENEDKLHHFLAYLVMGFFAWRAFAHLPWSTESIALASFGFCSIYGLSDEWHQSFVLGRDSSVSDWMADSIGGLVAALASYYHSQRITRD